MADYVLSANITADADKFNAAVRSAMSELKTLQDKTSAISDKITGAGKTISMVGAGMTAAITMPFAKAVQTTADFEQAMTKAGTIAGASAEELKAMTDAAIELGASTSLSGSEVAVAMSEMAAKGFDANQVIAAMPGVISAAEASGEDLALVADTVTSALNGFGLEADQSGRVADILAMSANKTAAGVEDLSYALKYAGPSASALGISIEELTAATGFMVDAGMAGGQAGTTLRMAFSRLVDPTDEAAMKMEQLGFSATDADGNFKPLNQIVGELSTSMEGMTEAQKLSTLSTIFGTEAASGMMILLQAGQEELQGMTKELENSAGASAEAAAQMKDNLTGSLDELSGSIESATISVMSQLTPMIREIAERVTGLVNAFNELPDGTKKLIAMTAGIAAVAGPVLTVLGVMIIGVGKVVGVLGFLLSPMGLVVAAIIGLVAAFAAAMIKSESFRNTVITAFNNVKDIAVGIFAELSEKMNAVWEKAQPVIAGFAASVPGLLSGMGQKMGSIFDAVKEKVQQYSKSSVRSFKARLRLSCRYFQISGISS